MKNGQILFPEETTLDAQQRRHVVLPPPKTQPSRDVFADAMLDQTSARQRRSPLDWVVSLGVHIAILAVLLIVPLYFTSKLETQKLNLTFLVAPPPPAAPPPPLASPAAPRAVRHLRQPVFTPGKLTAPSFIPHTVVAASGKGAIPDESALASPDGVPGRIPGGQAGGVFGGAFGGLLKSVPPMPVPEGPKKPVLVGGDVKPPRLLFGPPPDYPILARQTHITGTVVIEAIIDEHGNVTGMRALSGPPLLIPAALTAVSKRKYEPTILDGQATPIDLKVQVSFEVG